MNLVHNFLTDVAIVLGRFGSEILVAQNTDCGCTLTEPLSLLARV